MKSIRSIQKQSLKEIEIIAINDYSTDNSLKILKHLAKKDLRIKIFNNDKNHGLLYTRAMGILKSSGQYIMNLDPDDEFANTDNLEYLYNITNKSNVDIISFAYLQQSQYQLKCSNHNEIIEQPYLFTSAFDVNYHFTDYILWNKLIKKELLLKIYNVFKSRIYSEKWNYGEDTIWSILIHKYAKSMICTTKIIYLYNSNHDDSLMNNRGNYIELKNRIYILEMYKKIFKNKNESNYVNAHIIEFIEIINDSILLSLINSNFEIKRNIKKQLYHFIQNYNSSVQLIKTINNFINFKINIAFENI